MSTELDPWATDQPPEPRSLTRDDRIDAAARALIIEAPFSARSGSIWRSIAHLALASAYPELTTAAELDALPHHAVLIGAGGVAWERVVAPDNTLVDSGLCWARQEWTTTRISSAELVRNGETYVLVHRSAE